MAKRKFINNTATTSFGSPGREGQNASAFYETRLYADQPPSGAEAYFENPISAVDVIFNHSSQELGELPDNSIHLMVTSPPYNVGKEYDENLTLAEYLKFLHSVLKNIYRVLVLGGRACINVANLGRKPYILLNGLIAQEMINLGFLMRGEIVWNKAASASTSTAWGSWQSATNPILPDTHEYILVFSKGNFRREKVEGVKAPSPRKNFLNSPSRFGSSQRNQQKSGAPAPFPVELPYRLIQLYTFSNEIVLDPFIGSGQTALAAALKAGRHFIGYEVNEEYVNLAGQRIRENNETSS